MRLNNKLKPQPFWQVREGVNKLKYNLKTTNMNKGLIVAIVIFVLLIISGIVIYFVVKSKNDKNEVLEKQQQTIQQVQSTESASTQPTAQPAITAITGRPIVDKIAQKKPVLAAVLTRANNAGCNAKCDALHPFSKQKRNDCKKSC
jgi:hypothetical protein